jgi:hypothetical protein
MRAREFIFEDEQKFHKDHLSVMPGMHKYPGLDNSNPYHMWRYMIAAGAYDGKGNGYRLAKDGPIGQKLTTMSYTDEDAAILNDTAKSFGVKKKQVSSIRSVEPENIHKTSPIKGFKGYAR